MLSSRRHFLTATAALVGRPASLRAEVVAQPYLDMALRAARWIESSRQETEHGVRYPADPLKPESVGLNFYNGMPGIVAFYDPHHAPAYQGEHRLARRGSAHPWLDMILR